MDGTEIFNREGHSEEESDRSSKRGNGLVLSDEMNGRLKDLYEKHSRNRVHAFSADQKQKIKDLFEQFKDHKRCSYMIANALDGTGRISANQVSCKLKQLGLVVPKKKRSHASMHLRDEVLSDNCSKGAGDSDDETLLSLRNRSKQKRNGSHNDERHNKKVAQKLPEDMSDDEVLSSLLECHMYSP